MTGSLRSVAPPHETTSVAADRPPLLRRGTGFPAARCAQSRTDFVQPGHVLVVGHALRPGEVDLGKVRHLLVHPPLRLFRWNVDVSDGFGCELRRAALALTASRSHVRKELYRAHAHSGGRRGRRRHLIRVRRTGNRWPAHRSGGGSTAGKRAGTTARGGPGRRGPGRQPSPASVCSSNRGQRTTWPTRFSTAGSTTRGRPLHRAAAGR